MIELKIKLGEGKEINLSPQEARELYNQLDEMFGEKLKVPLTYPIFPSYPVYPSNPWWGDPTYVTPFRDVTISCDSIHSFSEGKAFGTNECISYSESIS